MRLFIRFLSLVFLFFIFTIFAHSVSAQSIDITANSIREPNDPKYIDGITRSVNITFSDIEAEAVAICTETKQDINECLFHGNLGVLKKSDFSKIIKACGDGNSALKGNFNAPPLKNHDCGDKDYFHEGFIYRLGAYTGSGENKVSLLAFGEFYVKHSYPWVKVEPEKKTGATRVKVTLWGTRPGGKNKNNYQIAVEGKDNKYMGKGCGEIPEEGIPTFRLGAQPTALIGHPAGNGVSGNIPATNLSSDISKAIGAFPPGRYVLKIREQINENRSILGVNPLGVLNKECDGGFPYMHIPITISNKNEFKVGEIQFDPDESDAAKEFDLFQGSKAVCADYDEKTETCKAVNTALNSFIGGPIDTTPEGFIKAMFQFVLMLAGFGAIIIIIYSGYRLITSNADKEKIAGARETITSAIVGLLFIIFSIVILEIIGVDILRIPGFDR